MNFGLLPRSDTKFACAVCCKYSDCAGDDGDRQIDCHESAAEVAILHLPKSVAEVKR